MESEIKNKNGMINKLKLIFFQVQCDFHDFLSLDLAILSLPGRRGENKNRHCRKVEEVFFIIIIISKLADAND